MSRHGAKTARQKGRMRAHAPRRSRGEPVIQRKIARASLLNIASVVMTGALFNSLLGAAMSFELNRPEFGGGSNS